MTYALILVKGRMEKRELTLKLLERISKDIEFEKQSKVRVENVFLSFGWPDFILLLRAKNIEQIRHAIGVIRNKLAGHGDYVDTSTIICSTVDEMKEKKKEWAEIS